MSYVRFTLVFSVYFFTIFSSSAQYCDSLVPSFTVDLTASPAMGWVSPPIVRDGNCCGTTAPDNCLEFIITLHPSTIAVSFNIASGAVPPGALFYQIDCGPMIPVGSPICLNGPGPHNLTFCKPGNNNNTFSITSFSHPIIGPDIALNAGCEGYIHAQYYNEPSISWTSVSPGAPGAYDYLLSCTAACDTTYITAPLSAPAYVDYVVCGLDIPDCNPNPICDTIRVTFIPPVDVSITASITNMCAGVQSTLTANTSGGSGSYSYLWSTAETSNSITVGGGTYFVEVIDTSGCHIATDTIVITENPLPIVNAGPDQAVCEGTAITLSGSGAVSYVWDNFVVDGVPFGQAVGTVVYTVIGTDANGCVDTDQVSITVNPLPIVNAGPDQTLCEGTPAVLSGSGGSSYLWDNGILNGVPFIPVVGSLNYTVIGTDMNGCSSNDNVNVTVNPLPIVNAGLDQTVCDGVSIEVSGFGAIVNSWDNGIYDGVPFVPSVGSTTYTLTGEDINGCTAMDQIVVTVNPLPMVDAGVNHQVCEGTAVTLTATGAAGLNWDNGITNGVPFVQGVGSIIYTVIGTDVNGCENSDQASVIVNPNPVVNAGPDQSSCDGTLVTLYATGTTSLNWNNGVLNGVPFTQAIGVVDYVVNDVFNTGCSAYDTVRVEVLPNPVIDAEDVEICLGDPAVLHGHGALYYSWSDGIIDGVEFYPTSTAEYAVVGTDANGCYGEALARVTVHVPPVVDFKILDLSLTTSDSETSFDNLTTGAVSYDWNFGDGSMNSNEFEPTHVFPTEHSGEYAITLTAYSIAGCPAQKIKYVHVFQDYTIYVPNTFTPDYNGVNEVFRPVMEGFDEQSFTMYIFNRWGEVVFESHDMNAGWDGTYSGQDFKVQDGVFTWKITADIKDTPDTKIFVGHVSILK